MFWRRRDEERKLTAPAIKRSQMTLLQPIVWTRPNHENNITTADRDAVHIALATVHGIDILLTWNWRHIANASIVGRLRRFVEKQGHTLPEIYTPDELMGITYEQND